MGPKLETFPQTPGKQMNMYKIYYIKKICNKTLNFIEINILGTHSS